MPEIKHAFSQGKMNKDFDERLLPNGEYRDAMNIEVSTSEGSNVGTVQSIKGNTKLPIAGAISLGVDEKCVGSIVDQKNDCAYFFMTNLERHVPEQDVLPVNGVKKFRDSIFRLKHNASNVHTVTPVFVDAYLEQHPIAAHSDTSVYAGVTFVTNGGYAEKVVLTSGHNVVEGMWIFFTSGNGGIARKVQSVQSNTISFATEPLLSQWITDNATWLEFSYHYPNVSGYLNYSTNTSPNRILRFDKDKLITGISILDDFLFWTDNFSEPKKLQVPRSIIGTDSGGRLSTKLMIENNMGIDVDYGLMTEQYLTVIKKYPTISPALDMSNSVRVGILSCIIGKKFKAADLVGNKTTVICSGVPGGVVDFKVNDILLLGVGVVTPSEFDAQLKITEINGLTITAVVMVFPTTYSNTWQNYQVMLQDSSKPIFDNKFVRFATRWKYIDGEYSSFSPFSNAAFIPGEFDYDTLDAYNLGMVNTLKTISIIDFVPLDIPSDVIEIDLLYTESDSPIVYTVDTISPYDELVDGTRNWDFITGSNNSKGKYVLESENIYGALPSEQILRPWDNVPRKALSQEIVGNRIVYGNYLQDYNLVHGTQSHGDYVKPIFNTYSSVKKLLGNEMIVNSYVEPLNVNNGSSAEGWNWDDDEDTTSNPTVTGWKLVDYYQYWYTGGGFQNFDTISQKYAVTKNKKFYQHVPGLKIGGTYQVSFRISNYQQGRINGPTLIAFDHTDTSNKLTSSNSGIKQYYGNGYYTTTVVIDVVRNDGPNVGGGGTYEGLATAGKTFFFQGSGGGGTQLNDINQTDPVIDPNWTGKAGFIGHVSHFSMREVFASNKESVKSDRDYQLGVVYSDEFGRQTPVLTDQSATFKISKEESDVETCVLSRLQNNVPSFASKFKYYIKDTSSSYYNLAVDRGYLAEDNQAWISFPSSERNKIDDETYLSLKKGHDSDNAIKAVDAVYKVIDIENEAPSYIKKERVTLGLCTGSTSSSGNLNGVFNRFEHRPFSSSRLLAINKAEWLEETFVDLDSTDAGFDPTVEVQEIQFIKGDGFLSSWYEISTRQVVDIGGQEYYYITLKNAIDENEAIYIINETGSNVTTPDGVVVNNLNFYPDVEFKLVRTRDKTNLKEFIGKFFVKVRSNEYLNSFLVSGATTKDDVISVSTTSFFLADFTARASGGMGVKGGSQNLLTYLSLSDPAAQDPYYDLRGSYTCVVSGSNPAGYPNDANPVFVTQVSPSYTWDSGVIQYSQTSRDSGYAIPGDPSSAPKTGGTGNDGNFQWLIRGSESAKEAWERLLKFELFSTWTLGGSTTPGMSGDTRSEFFIDNVGYVGVLPGTDVVYGKYVDHSLFSHQSDPTMLITDGGMNRRNTYDDGTGPSNGFAGQGDSSPSFHGTGTERDNCRFGRGIWQSTGDEKDFDGINLDNWFTPGKTYMEISYSRVNSRTGHKDIDPNLIESGFANENAWSVGTLDNEAHDEERFFVDKLVRGSRFRFSNDANNRTYTIRKVKTEKRFNHTIFPGATFNNAYPQCELATRIGIDPIAGGNNYAFDNVKWSDLPTPLQENDPLISRLSANYKWDNTDYTVRNMDTVDGWNANGYNIKVEVNGPYSWYLEKKRFGLASNRRKTWILEIQEESGAPKLTDETHLFGHVAGLDHNSKRLIEFVTVATEGGDQLTSDNPAIFETVPKDSVGLDLYYAASDFIPIAEHGNEQELPFYNCYSFGNGVESNRIRDDFNAKLLDLNPIVSTTIKEQYLQDRKLNGLIYSGIYNSASSVNELNQFVAANKITKNINPIYGSIQKLYTRNTDLVVLCEDKVIKVLANKDALYNADGNPQLISTNTVLGQSQPFAGEYGISKNPESFTSQSYRVYFTDKQRGAVLRLSMDGLTVISDNGMRDWFKDNLKAATGLSGSYDDNKDEYNLHVKGSTNYTLSFSENVKGWTSFKSFIPDEGLSISNNYYTFANENTTSNAYLWLHHTNDLQANFYGKVPTTSEQASLTLILNEEPGVVKNFVNLSYEGTQSAVDINTNLGDSGYYNLTAVPGWYAQSITTDLQSGEINEFIEKEGKWFNFIKGDSTVTTNLDTAEFTVQGLGKITSHTNTA